MEILIVIGIIWWILEFLAKLINEIALAAENISLRLRRKGIPSGNEVDPGNEHWGAQ